MANAVSSVQGLAALDQLIRAQAAKPKTQNSAIPQDTVTLSQAAKAAAAASQPAKTSSGNRY